jgi:HD-like signal output (HDOD) protein
LIRAVGSDVGLAARLVRCAGAVRPGTDTLAEAVAALGVRKACDLVVAAATRQMLAPADVQVQALWNHALATAIAAEELARTTRRVDPARAFLPGLFHDVGRIAFLLTDGMSFDVIQDLVTSGEADALACEREWYGFTHAEAGAILAEDWGLALDQCEAIRWHHTPADAPPEGRELAALLEAADRLAYAAGSGAGPTPRTTRAAGPVKLSAEDEAACAQRVQRAVAAQATLLE